MIVRSLSLANFKQYKNEKIDFPEGLCGIIGKNGSGKSSLFDAILMALFGEIPATKEYLRYQKAGEKEAVAIVLEMTLDGKEYEIRREFRGKNLTAQARLLCNGEELATGQKEVTETMVRLIGMGKDSFTRSVFAGQKELGQLSELTGAERRVFIREILGVTRIDEVQKLVREDERRIKNEIAGQQKLLMSGEERTAKENELQGLAARIAALEKETLRLEKGLEQKTAALKQAKIASLAEQERFRKHTALTSRLEIARNQKTTTEREIEHNQAKQKEIHGLESKFQGLHESENRFSEVKKELERQETAKEKYIQAREIQSQLQALEDERKKLLLQCAELGIRDATEESLTHALTEALEEGSKTDQTLEAATAAREALSGQATALARLAAERTENIRTLESRGPHSDCPTCLRPLEDAFQSTLLKLRAEIDGYDRERSALLKKETELARTIQSLKQTEKSGRERIQAVKIKSTVLEQANKKVKDAQKKRQGLGEILFDEKAYAGTKKAYAELSALHDEYVGLAQKMKELPTLEKALTGLEDNLAGFVRQAEQAETERTTLGFSEKTYQALLAATEAAETARDEANRQLSEKREELLSHRHQRAAAEKELADDRGRREAIAAEEAETLVLQKLVVLMENFKNALLSRVQPLIAHYASALFTRLTRGRYESIKIDEDFRFLIFDDGDYFPIERFSGGERDLANLCLRLALSSAIRDLEGAATPSFLGFDEIFGSQDRERRYEILAALLKLQEEYRQILIISHDEELKDEFPRILEVRRTQDGSRTNWL